MRLVSIASGSSGNCTYVGTDRAHLLIDAGISCKRIDCGLKELDIKSGELDGIFITHEHSDHIQGLRVMSKKFAVPIYGTPETLDAIREKDKKGEIDSGLFCDIYPDQEVKLKDITVRPFSTSHDAANPVAYRIDSETHSVAVVTDLGVYDQGIVEHLQELDALILEANHDIRMLEIGTYPYYLKRRILGRYGHLSNESAGKLLNELLHDNMKHIMLGHLSKENNYEALAYETVCCEVNLGENEYHSSDFPISVAKRDMVSAVIEV